MRRPQQLCAYHVGHISTGYILLRSSHSFDGGLITIDSSYVAKVEDSDEHRTYLYHVADRINLENLDNGKACKSLLGKSAVARLLLCRETVESRGGI